MPQFNWGTRQRHVPQAHCTAVQINKTSYKYIVISRYVFHTFPDPHEILHLLQGTGTPSKMLRASPLPKRRSDSCACARTSSSSSFTKAETWWWPAQNGEVFSYKGGAKLTKSKVNGVEILGIYIFNVYIYIYYIYIYIPVVPRKAVTEVSKIGNL